MATVTQYEDSPFVRTAYQNGQPVYRWSKPEIEAIRAEQALLAKEVTCQPMGYYTADIVKQWSRQ